MPQTAESNAAWYDSRLLEFDMGRIGITRGGPAAAVVLLASVACGASGENPDGGSDAALESPSVGTDAAADAENGMVDAGHDASSTTDAGTGTTDADGEGGPSPAAFPSVLHTSGRHLADANDYVLPPMKGFSIQVGPWSQGTLDAIASKGATFERLVVFWNTLQDSDCSALSLAGASYVSNIDQHLAWAKSAGIYTELELHLNVGRVPSCSTANMPAGASETDDYITHGQWITHYLADRYGNPGSPQYTKDVIGFGVNEPPPPSAASLDAANPALEAAQSTMLAWVRGANGTGGPAPAWIGFVAYAWANSAPIPNAAYGGQNNQSFAAANPLAYDGVGGNVVLDAHDYFTGCALSAWDGSGDPGNCDGRNRYGMPFHDTSGGPEIEVADGIYTTYPPAQNGNTGETRSLAQTQLASWIRPYVTFTSNASIPLMIGEFGWYATGMANDGSDLAYIQDLMASWGPAFPVIEMEWDYDVTQSHDGWAANPGSGASGDIDPDGWLAFTDAWLN